MIIVCPRLRPYIRGCTRSVYAPESTAADGGFASKANAEYAISQGVVNVSFSKRVGLSCFGNPSQFF